jgi:hypothetical protein
MQINGHGLKVDLPNGWDGRLFISEALTRPVIQAANFPLPSTDNDAGDGAQAAMPSDGVYVNIFEYPPEPLFFRSGSGWIEASPPIALGRSDISYLVEGVRAPAYVVKPMLISGRVIQLGVAFGSPGPSNRAWADANAVVRSLAVGAIP